MWKIKRSLIEDACEAARKYYPDEFMCFLGGDKKKKTVDEVVMLPNTSGEDYATISEIVIPIDESIVGSLHSHPDSSAEPSEEDLKFFAKHPINVIIDGTYSPAGARFYDQKGGRIRPEII